MIVLHSSWKIKLPNLCLCMGGSQHFCHFTYVTAHCPTLPSLYLCHSSFSNTSVASPTSQFILQPFIRFCFVTNSSLNSPGEPRVSCSWVLWRSLTSQAISVAFYIEREKSGKFCSEALISAWGSYSAVNVRHRTNGFTSLPKEATLRIFTLWKNPSTPAEFEPANLGSSGDRDNHWTTGLVRNR